MITVIFHIDLRKVVFGAHCTSEEGVAIQAIQKSIDDEEGIVSGIQTGAFSHAVLRLPKNEKALGALSYWCNYGKIPYKTLWLNDVSEWRDG